MKFSLKCLFFLALSGIGDIKFKVCPDFIGSVEKAGTRLFVFRPNHKIRETVVRPVSTKAYTIETTSELSVEQNLPGL